MAFRNPIVVFAGYTFNILSLLKLLFPSMSLGPKHTSIREAFFHSILLFDENELLKHSTVFEGFCFIFFLAVTTCNNTHCCRGSLSPRGQRLPHYYSRTIVPPKNLSRFFFPPQHSEVQAIRH